MSFANGFKKITSELNVGLWIFKRNIGLRSTCKGAALNGLKCNDVSLLMQPLPLSLCNSKPEKLCIAFPQADIAIKKNIIEPVKNIKINFELPIRGSTDAPLDLPFHIKTEIKDPSAGVVINKRATHLVIIRRRKMKKHKYKKRLKKYKIALEQKKIRKKLAKEERLQMSLKEILSEMNDYCPEKYVTETLEKVNWEKPITRVRGYLAPKWVVNDYIEWKKYNKQLRERIKECSEQ